MSASNGLRLAAKDDGAGSDIHWLPPWAWSWIRQNRLLHPSLMRARVSWIDRFDHQSGSLHHFLEVRKRELPLLHRHPGTTATLQPPELPPPGRVRDFARTADLGPTSFAWSNHLLSEGDAGDLTPLIHCNCWDLRQYSGSDNKAEAAKQASCFRTPKNCAHLPQARSSQRRTTTDARHTYDVRRTTDDVRRTTCDGGRTTCDVRRSNVLT